MVFVCRECIFAKNNSTIEHHDLTELVFYTYALHVEPHPACLQKPQLHPNNCSSLVLTYQDSEREAARRDYNLWCVWIVGLYSSTEDVPLTV